MRLGMISPVPHRHLSRARTDGHPQTAQRCVVSDRQNDETAQSTTHYTSSSLSFISSLNASIFPLLSRLMAA